MPQQNSPRPVILGFFAHPDDETLSAGGVLALLARHADVHVVTATRGEMGEVVAPEGQRTDVDRNELPNLRTAEVRAACAALGVKTQEFLDGGDGRFQDSGMQWADDRRIRAIPDPRAPREAFSLADLDEAASVLARKILDLRPQMIITEEPAGGYGHPDHIRCNEVTMRAVALAAAEWRVPLVTHAVHDEARTRSANAELAQLAGVPSKDSFGAELFLPDLVAPLRSGVSATADVVVSTAQVTRQVADAMRAHGSQVHVVQEHHGREIAGWYALTNNDLKPILTHAALAVATGWGTRSQLREFLLRLELPLLEAPAAPPSRVMPALIGLFSLIAGVFVGFAGSFTHRANPPWGLALALVGVLAGAVMSRTLGTLRSSFAYALGAIGSVLIIGSVNRAGDIVIGNDILGVGWMIGMVLMTFIGGLIGGGVTRTPNPAVKAREGKRDR